MPAKTFVQALGAIKNDAAQEMALTVTKEIDQRAAFERQERPNNENIHKTLDKARARLAIPSAAAVLIAAKVDVGFINRSIQEGKRYNVYAIDKVSDIARFLKNGKQLNAYNNAVCRSLFKFRAAGESFTGEMAKAAISDKIRVTAQMQKILVRHTVSESTAPTQASSSMNALETLGIVANKGTQKHPVYELTDTPQTKRLEELLAA
jgi:hypothetical protein